MRVERIPRAPVREAAVTFAYLGAALLLIASRPTSGAAQWSTTYESVYLPGSFNWKFRDNYPAADRLFNAFDYGHAILYERLWSEPDAPVSRLEGREYDFITRKLLVNPPSLPLEEAAIEVAYAKLAPEAKAMFDWAHLFHRQLYDVWADERVPRDEKDARVAELLRYYKSRPGLAFSSRPKSMDLMEGQPYSLAFRQKYPKFNGLIWAYHWLQVGLYEPLVVGRNLDERQTGVLAAVARFRQMIENAPTNMPRTMPMTAAIAPTFSARYPEAAIIFDNLHSMHDVVSDILANPTVPRRDKRARILEAGRRYRDATSFVMTTAEWRDMAQMMGVENMGGPAVGFLGTFPTPTVARGAATAGMDHATMPRAATGDSLTEDHSKMGHSRIAGSESDSADVARVVTGFHAALAAGDSAAVLRLLAEDVVILESGGVETLDDYRAHHLPADIAFARAVPSRHGPIRVRLRGDVAWANATSLTTGEFRDRPVNSSGAELVVLSREAAGWKIRAIHWSSRVRK